ncbi:hypothetical protein [Streptomyces sp. NBC_00286]|uniref:hypothetical protein n=1 Tax=Streptomyces sp. NBC_00286 TaxID=2975701 RepID=UPI002E2900A3|nr:hypothetical protein [Streptomyces sp. NBC_00286]
MRGSWLPPCIRAVLASGGVGGGVLPSSGSLSGGENTVAGSGTERSSPASALVSVPAHGVAAPGVPGPPPEPCSDPPPADGHDGAPGAEDPDGDVPDGDVPDGELPLPDAPLAAPASAAAAAGRAPAPSDEPDDERDEPEAEPGEPTEPEGAPDAPAEPEGAPGEPADPEGEPAPAPSRRSGIPIRSAASCNHSGGVSRNDVWFRSTRAGGAGAGSGAASGSPYSSSYRRMTSPTGSEGHSVASPLSRAITSRCAPPSERGPSARSSAQTTKPSSNSRTRTSRC